MVVRQTGLGHLRRGLAAGSRRRDRLLPARRSSPSPPAPPPPGPAPPPGYGPGPVAPPLVQPRLAGFWRRFVAYVIDAIIIGVVSAFIAAVVGAIVRASALDTAGLTREGLLGLVVGLLYFGYFWSRLAQSPGYMAMGMRLVRVDGAPVSFGLAMLRYLIIYISFGLCLIPALVSAVMIVTASRKQAIQDLVVNTLVVRT